MAGNAGIIPTGGVRLLKRIVYRMLKFGHEYVDKGTQYYEDRYRQQQIQFLRKRAAKLGLQIIAPLEA